MFGTSRKRKQRAKGRKLGYIRKESENKPVYVVSVDQIQSAQPGLVPQLVGKLTSALICDSEVTMDHFSDLTYVYLMISTVQDETLSGKEDFKDGLPHLESNSIDIRQKMKDFLKKLLYLQLRIPTRK